MAEWDGRMTEVLSVAAFRLAERAGHCGHRAITMANHRQAELADPFAGRRLMVTMDQSVLDQHSPEVAMAAKGVTRGTHRGPAPSEQQGEWK